LVVRVGPLNRAVRDVNDPVYRSTGLPKLDPAVAVLIASRTATPGAVVKALNFASPAVFTFMLLVPELSSWLLVQYEDEYCSAEDVPSTFIASIHPFTSHHARYVSDWLLGLYSHRTAWEIPQVLRMSILDRPGNLAESPH
jgi:hypothetical protein